MKTSVLCASPSEPLTAGSRKAGSRKRVCSRNLWFQFSVLFAAAVGQASGALINGGFETGNLTGWQSLGNVTTSSGLAYPAASGSVLPSSGDYAARLATNGVSASNIAAAMGISELTLQAANGGIDATNGSLLYQTFSLNAGDQTTFRWNFVEQDYVPYDDYAFYGISFEGGPANVTMFASLATVGPDSNSTINGWEDLNVIFPQTGNYTMYFGIVNALDTGLDSDLWIDGVGEPPIDDVPEAGSVLALGLLVGGVALLRSRPRPVAA